MTSASELLRQGRRDEVWRKYCGFLDLSLEEFMEIQRRLLMEQIDLLSKCELGRKLLGNKVPASVEEFREIVPLTTYKDYLPYLSERKEEALAEKPITWARTSGRSGEYAAKWVPYTKRMYDKWGELTLGSMILAASSKRGEVNVQPNDTLLAVVAPMPYVSAILTRALAETFPLTILPPQESEADFAERIEEGFKLALSMGIDHFYGLSSVLVKIGERFSQGLSSFEFSPFLLRPRVLFRLARGVIKARLQRRNLLPSDLWRVKGIMTGGTDASLLKDAIAEYWGTRPIEGYACTEGGALAVQSWDCKGMTFYPDSSFLEFVPYEEHLRTKQDPNYQPNTVLLDQVEPGIYEVVLSNFYGGVFVRYRVGDLIRVISLKDERHRINLPQVEFYSRADDVIALAGFCVLTERTVWQAIESAGFRYVDWTAWKEYKQGEGTLRICVELDPNETATEDELEAAIHNSLEKVDPDYADLNRMLGATPVSVTILSPGSFMRYYMAKQREGADLAHLKPPHINPTAEVVKQLMSE